MSDLFSDYAARCALRGWQLWRSDAADGPVRYFAAKWNRVLVLADLPEVERFLERAGFLREGSA
jgi:hypothetical protein